MGSALRRVALLLFASGFCALVYQTAWLRLFRLVFGASTAASAAVLAIFMAGLGFGGLLLGSRADRHRSPLGFYASLETGIAVLAGLSPWLVGLVERIYIALGGSSTLGLGGSTVVRLLLSTLVLGAPTFLMGGTLPAVARAVERGADRGRRAVGLLYAVNTLGAVLGTLLTTFFALEALGIRKTVWIAALLNLLVALAARNYARTLDAAPAADENAAVPEVAEDGPAGEGDEPRTGWLVPVAAALVGFAFLLMELVWYRMLAPLLGGSSYTFGLILAVALLGIGLGGLLYGMGERARRPTLLAFAGTCSLEALFIALPFALGDRVAVMAAQLRPLGGAGFLPLIGAWTAVTVLVVLPAAIVAGYQFPLLIALLGSGRRRVGREVGVAYAANTLGAIAGSIAGGFGLLPLLTAPGVWRLVVALLLALAAVAVLAGIRAGSPLRSALAPLAAGLAGLLLCASPGPSAFWRHSPIGAGRIQVQGWRSPNDIRMDVQEMRRRTVWEADGVESSVALNAGDDYAFVINGKADGSIRGDAPTQVMSGLLGTLLHPAPKRALVIGLGTGSTAGWLAQVPSIERVDVVELEPAILHVARVLAAANHDVLANPKVHVVIGDGRELLLTTRSTYDIIFSEPSNPYRAGIASLFTEDFYRAARQRLRPGGLFLQWLQGYELDAGVVRTAFATLGTVFPAVESWQIHGGDLLLSATAEPLVHDVDRVRARLTQEPYRSALPWIWGVDDAEGFYASYVASAAFTEAVRQAEDGAINTDDHPVLEFGFAKNLGRVGLFDIPRLRALAERRGEDRPTTTGAFRASLDWNRVRELRVARGLYWGEDVADPDPGGDPAARQRIAARHAYLRQDLPAACSLWLAQPEPPSAHADLLLVTECLAATGHHQAPLAAERLRGVQPAEADLMLALWHENAHRPAEAARHLTAAFVALRTQPWAPRQLVVRLLPLAIRLAREDRALALPLFQALAPPFVVGLGEQERLSVRLELAKLTGDPALCVDGLAPFEPHVPWGGDFLTYRYACYRKAGHPLAARAGRDLEEYLEHAPPNLGEGLTPASP